MRESRFTDVITAMRLGGAIVELEVVNENN